jgi:hypothetical protein
VRTRYRCESGHWPSYTKPYAWRELRRTPLRAGEKVAADLVAAIRQGGRHAHRFRRSCTSKPNRGKRPYLAEGAGGVALVPPDMTRHGFADVTGYHIGKPAWRG